MLINGDNYELQVLHTTFDKSECHLFMAEYLKEKIIVDGRSNKAFHENENIISVYDYHYFYSKTLRCKLILVEYTDTKQL
jgi:hypothetical protein